MFPSSEYLTHLAYGIRRGSVFRTRLKDVAGMIAQGVIDYRKLEVDI